MSWAGSEGPHSVMALEPCPVLSQGAKLTGISDELENLLFFFKAVLLAL